MKRKHTIIVLSVILVFCVISITLGYVFYLSKITKYPDNPGDTDTPIEVNLQVSDNVITMLNSTEDKIINAIGDASIIWSMFSTQSKLNVTFFGKNHRLVPFSYDDVTCENEEITDIQEYAQTKTTNSDAGSMTIEIKNEIIAPGQIDPDCTGPACTHIWSCEKSGDKDEIKRFDIQLNLAEFSIRAENINTNDYDLKTLIAHNIGHAVGLSHCSPGDTVESCNKKLNSGMSDPPETAIMYKKVFPGIVKNNLGEDDKNAVIALYGQLSQNKLAVQSEMNNFIQVAQKGCPCLLPQDETDPKYILSTNESEALVEYNQTLAENSLNTLEKRKEYAHYYQNLHLTAYSKLSIPAERYLIDGMSNMSNRLTQIPIERLQAMRGVIIANIQEKKSIIDDFPYELDPRFYSFTQAELNMMIQIRKAIIDEISIR